MLESKITDANGKLRMRSKTSQVVPMQTGVPLIIK